MRNTQSAFKPHTTLNPTEGDVDTKPVSDGLPDIVSVSELPEIKATHPSQYSKYDAIKVGQAIPNLTSTQASSICLRLRKLGFTMRTTKVGHEAYVVQRTEPRKSA